MKKQTKSILITLIVVIVIIAIGFAGCQDDYPITHDYHRPHLSNKVFNVKIITKTSYQFNIIHMTDSIKVYDGSRYVGTCIDNNLDSLLIQDNQ